MSRASRPAERIRVRRFPKKGRYDAATVESILDRGLIAHVAFVDRGEPVCIPMLYARLGRQLYFHGSRASRMMRELGAGRSACVTVTLLQGLVLARSAFEHSANYESVVVFGRFEEVEDLEQRRSALAAWTNKLLPGRWDEVRPPSAKELKATMVLALQLGQASAKVRYGPPDDDETDDGALDVWAGELPIVNSYADPIPSPGLRQGIPLSASIRRMLTADADGAHE